MKQNPSVIQSRPNESIAPHMILDIIIEISSSHILNINHSSTRRIRKLTQDPITIACKKIKQSGYYPLTCVDNITAHSFGSWINIFSKTLARSAKREKITIVGGEMAQMPDTYPPGYVGFVISIIGIKI